MSQELIYDAIGDDNELETLESLKENLLPIIKEDNSKTIKNSIQKIEKKIEDGIEDIERNSEKYAYSRRYAWRKTCADGKAYGLDPLDFETLEEYNEELAFYEEE